MRRSDEKNATLFKTVNEYVLHYHYHFKEDIRHHQFTVEELDKLSRKAEIQFNQWKQQIPIENAIKDANSIFENDKDLTEKIKKYEKLKTEKAPDKLLRELLEQIIVMKAYIHCADQFLNVCRKLMNPYGIEVGAGEKSKNLVSLTKTPLAESAQYVSYLDLYEIDNSLDKTANLIKTSLSTVDACERAKKDELDRFQRSSKLNTQTPQENAKALFRLFMRFNLFTRVINEAQDTLQLQAAMRRRAPLNAGETINNNYNNDSNLNINNYNNESNLNINQYNNESNLNINNYNNESNLNINNYNNESNLNINNYNNDSNLNNNNNNVSYNTNLFDLSSIQKQTRFDTIEKYANYFSLSLDIANTISIYNLDQLVAEAKNKFLDWNNQKPIIKAMNLAKKDLSELQGKVANMIKQYETENNDRKAYLAQKIISQQTELHYADTFLKNCKRHLLDFGVEPKNVETQHVSLSDIYNIQESLKAEWKALLKNLTLQKPGDCDDAKTKEEIFCNNTIAQKKQEIIEHPEMAEAIGKEIIKLQIRVKYFSRSFDKLKESLTRQQPSLFTRDNNNTLNKSGSSKSYSKKP